MATKVQRAVAMSTPPRQQMKKRTLYSEQEKASLLENFDLEVEDKIRAFKACLTTQLNSFLMRQETEILKIPRDLRNMTLKELEAVWGGSWAGTVQRIAKLKIEEREKEEAERREKARLEEEARGKRKRAEEASSSSPSRSTKNARKDIPGSTKKMPGSTSKKRLAGKTPRANFSNGQGPSSLPQDHVFNPLLPTTPGFARKPRRNESFFSANGSPIVISRSIDGEDGPSSGTQRHDAKRDDGRESEDDQDDDDDDLPDPEALEAKLLAQSTKPVPSSPNSRPSSRKPKRAPSLIFRKSIAPHSLQPLEDPEELASIPLSDGRTVTFNPLDLSPGRIDREMEEGGIGDQEKIKVKGKVKDAVFQALQAKMEKWKGLG